MITLAENSGYFNHSKNTERVKRRPLVKDKLTTNTSVIDTLDNNNKEIADMNTLKLLQESGIAYRDESTEMAVSLDLFPTLPEIGLQLENSVDIFENIFEKTMQNYIKSMDEFII